jgi:hypothetical protein
VIVVCWNAEDVLGRCLEHLLEQDYPSCEVIVVDDGSRDDTVAVAEAAAARGELKIVRSARNRGCPSARNLGLRHAHGEIVAFVDADGFAAPDWLRGIVAAFAGDETIGGVASTVFYDDNPLVLNGAGGTVNRQGWAADLSMNESYESARIVAEALYPMGCGMAIRREALARVGPFDDRMLNYYDDVDYGVRLWRAGYRVAVASEAWIDHRATLGDSTRKRLLCERHRMRVVLKHAPARALGSWAAHEARSLRAASCAGRAQRLRAIAWNACHLASVLRHRRADRGPQPPSRLSDASWGDAFPVGVPARSTPRPEMAADGLDMASPMTPDQLSYGWFPAETVAGRSFRWAAERAAVLVSLQRPVRVLRLDYSHPPIDTGGIELDVRALDASEPSDAIRSVRLPWRFIARSVENHPIALEPGDYEIVFGVSGRGWTDPPAETRRLGFALARLRLAESLELPANGLEMAGAGVERQLVSGWFEAEQGPTRSYRWAGASAGALVRVAGRARGLRLSYRLPPVSIGSLAIAIRPLGEESTAWSSEIAWSDGDWHERALPLELDPGEYLVTFVTDSAWSNVDGRDAGLWAENRSLGCAISSLAFDV